MLGEDLLDVPLDGGRAPPGFGSDLVDGLSPGQRRLNPRRRADLRFQPPYGPGLNPIKLDFSKLKAYPKRRAARSVIRHRRRG